LGTSSLLLFDPSMEFTVGCRPKSSNCFDGTVVVDREVACIAQLSRALSRILTLFKKFGLSSYIVHRLSFEIKVVAWRDGCQEF